MKSSLTARSEYQNDAAAVDTGAAGSAFNETLNAPRTEAELESLSRSTASALRPIVEGSVYANAAKLAGRLNASAIRPEERQALLEERQSLLDKKLAGQITKKEVNRLEYVRWNLDRIEDAKYGSGLDILETEVTKYEEFGANLAALQEQLTQAAENERDSQRRRSRGYRR